MAAAGVSSNLYQASNKIESADASTCSEDGVRSVTLAGCARVTGKPELIGSSAGSVPINALIVTLHPRSSATRKKIASL
jgi:hypothetical protein